TLGAIGPGAELAIPELVLILQNADESIRLDATLALAGIGQAAVPSLIEVLNSSNAYMQVLAAIALGEIGSDALPAANKLAELLYSPNIERSQSGIASIQLTNLSTPKVGPDLGVQFSAALALGKIGFPAEAAVPYLIALLRFGDPDIQIEAAYALGNMGATAQAAIPDLINVMGMGEFDAKESVILARDSATEALIKIDDLAVSALVEALKDNNVITHSRGTYALSKIGAPAVQALIDTLANPDIHIRRRAAFALGQTGNIALPALLDALESTDLDVRKAAAAALGMTQIPNGQSIIALRTVVENEENDLDLRRISALALEELGSDSRTFFEVHNFPSSQTATCFQFTSPSSSPILLLYPDTYIFDTLTSDCLLTYRESSGSQDSLQSSSGNIWQKLCRAVGC
ncbi:MAG: HEAT repeat domain-containing protein, partial [Cyanobacteria bacterium J06635_15]